MPSRIAGNGSGVNPWLVPESAKEQRLGWHVPEYLKGVGVELHAHRSALSVPPSYSKSYFYACPKSLAHPVSHETSYTCDNLFKAERCTWCLF